MIAIGRLIAEFRYRYQKNPKITPKLIHSAFLLVAFIFTQVHYIYKELTNKRK